ncbi:hypothetical protein BN381_780015 [Candidatus Microthrix parvicella RN1]|uniref:Uncharacterized protein n=1 Tax=Candidatus Neomicrothrix parvicella RN1 TaxID=1229780 RepID=R4Z6M9_9ACTN|nr:hypothetical protein BN381_780015 [Candidatus Microthrix parvicella RN1]
MTRLRCKGRRRGDLSDDFTGGTAYACLLLKFPHGSFPRSLALINRSSGEFCERLLMSDPPCVDQDGALVGHPSDHWYRITLLDNVVGVQPVRDSVDGPEGISENLRSAYHSISQMNSSVKLAAATSRADRNRALQEPRLYRRERGQSHSTPLARLPRLEKPSRVRRWP